MSRIQSLVYFSSLVLTAISCNKIKEANDPVKGSEQSSATAATDTLPPPYATPSASKNSVVIGWPADKKPVAPVGFTVSRFGAGFIAPRWIYQGPNGDVFVSECKTSSNSPSRITILRDANKDGVPELKQTFLQGLNWPLGMLILKGNFYVANTDGIMQYPYTTGQTAINGPGKKILTLPAGGYNNHWTRNIIANSAGTKIYVSVGSGSNVAEHGMANEVRRADILEINPDGTGERVFSSGLRNPVGMAWAPVTNALWTAVNERDLLGDNLVPDFLTSVKDGAFYGWPYAYFGNHEDPRLKGQRPDLVAKTIVPDIDLGSHTASLGLAFYNKTGFPAKYQGGAFIGQHGSWNRSAFVGYKVAFVPFANGVPAGRPEAFLTGFIANASTNQVYGRPVGVCVLADGSMLVADDAANTVWRISYKSQNQPPIARAGDDYTLSLSWNYSPLLNATTSTDADGWIRAISWAMISGPSTYRFENPNTGKTHVTFTGVGTYVFRVTVTDNLYATATDTKQIIVTK